MAATPKAEVLLVDPDPASAARIVEGLPLDRYAVERVDTTEKAYNCLESGRFTVLVTVLKAPGMDGIRIMNVAHDRSPDLCAILIAETPDIELATEAMRLGAYDVQTQPLNIAKLEAVIERGISHQALVQEHFRLQRRLDERYGLGGIVGQSRAIAKVYSRIRQLGPSSAPVILVGESGTGKNLAAQVLHSVGSRAEGPFVKLFAGDNSQGLIKRELFGHAAGAFAGAPESRPGYTELADGGTLYLDRAAGLDRVVAEQLLTAIETGKTQRLGESKSVSSSFRLIVSVHPDLDRNDPAQPFLDELTQRFDAATVELPPLRQRVSDIPGLAEHFLGQLSRPGLLKARRLTRRAIEGLEQYEWPGNIRELKEAVETMAIKWPGREELDTAQLPRYIRGAISGGEGTIAIRVGTTMNDIERQAIEATLIDCGYDKEKTARVLGIGLRTLYRKLKQYDEE